MLGDGLPIEQIASQLVARKFPATPKIEAQNCNVNLTTSKHNIRIERL